MNFVIASIFEIKATIGKYHTVCRNIDSAPMGIFSMILFILESDKLPHAGKD